MGSLFRKGANFTAAMAFELGSTNLVAELGIIMAILLGWQFTLAEFLGAPLMVAIMALLFRIFLKPEQANKGVRGIMEGHAEMDMAVAEGPSPVAPAKFAAEKVRLRALKIPDLGYRPGSLPRYTRSHAISGVPHNCYACAVHLPYLSAP
jgi:uncharacterized membrane protein YraQ (UPF0718 family)